MDKPKISIIVPIYNGEKHLPKTLDSILANTFQEFELLLINDGSTDGTQAICEAYAAQNKRIHIITQKNKGLSGARNAGMDRAKGEYLAFIDADDLVEKTYFAHLFAYAEAHHLDWVECGRWIDDGGAPKRHHLFDKDLLAQGEEIRDIVFRHIFYSEGGIIWEHSTSACAGLYRREAIGGLRFREKITYAEDILFNDVFLHAIQAYGYLHEPLYHYVRANSVMSTEFRADFIQEITTLLESLVVYREQYGDPLTKEELTHEAKSLLGIFFMHIFPHSNRTSRAEKYHLFEEILTRPVIQSLWDAITPDICENRAFRLLIVLLKKKWYEQLYLLWRIRQASKRWSRR